MLSRVAALLCLLGAAASVSADESIDTSFIYDCMVCKYSVETALQKKLSIKDACAEIFEKDEGACPSYFSRHEESFSLDHHQTSPADARAVCEAAGVCSDLSAEGWRAVAETRRRESQKIQSASGLDIRVAKAYGSRGYDKVRVSVISSEPIQADIFSYTEAFKYRWTNNVLNTGIVTVIPGEVTTIDIAGEKFDIRVPAEDAPVRGVIVADPCFSNEFVWCSYGDDFDTYNRSTQLLNAINSHEDNDFWMILGDNFYDVSGEPTAEWFAGLSKETKSRVFGSVPGNHGTLPPPCFMNIIVC